MACDLTIGRDRVCKDGLGGNTELYLFNPIKDPFTVANGVATAINAGLTTVFKYELEGDGNTLTQEEVSDRNTATTVNTQTIVAILKKMDAVTGNELDTMAKGYPMAVVEDRNGNLHAIGIDDGIDFTVSATTGGAKTDLNGYTITGVSTTGATAPILDSATATAFKALV